VSVVDINKLSHSHKCCNVLIAVCLISASYNMIRDTIRAFETGFFEVTFKVVCSTFTACSEQHVVCTEVMGEI